MAKMKWFDVVALVLFLVLLIVGGINWGVYGFTYLFGTAFNLVESILGIIVITAILVRLIGLEPKKKIGQSIENESTKPRTKGN